MHPFTRPAEHERRAKKRFMMCLSRRASARRIAAVLLASTAGCIARPSKEVKQPRAGRIVGDRMCLVYSHRYQISLAGLEKLHPFDIRKYEKIYLRLVGDGLVRPSDVFVPEEIGREDLLRVHTADYLDRKLRTSALLARYLEVGPLAIVPGTITDAAVLRPFRHASGGTLLAARLAMRHGMAINLGGGYHHAEPATGGGFCIYADMPIAIRALQAERAIHRALVVDLDVHQGNGTAVCFEGDDDVFTFDVHQADIYPIPKQQNDLDVPLPAGTDDEAFLTVLAEHLPRAFDAARPDIVIYRAGVDGLSGDPLADFELTIDGIVKRDKMVFDESATRGVPIVMTLGGGYSRDAWRAQYESIRNLLRTRWVDSATPVVTLEAIME